MLHLDKEPLSPGVEAHLHPETLDVDDIGWIDGLGKLAAVEVRGIIAEEKNAVGSLDCFFDVALCFHGQSRLSLTFTPGLTLEVMPEYTPPNLELSSVTAPFPYAVTK